MKMKKIHIQMLAVAILTAAGSIQVQAKPANEVTIDFTALSFTDLNSLNLLLAADGVTVSTGVGTVSGGSSSPLFTQTDPSAIDLLFNFANPVSDVDVSNWDTSGGNAVGMTVFDVNTTPVAGLSLYNTADDLGGFSSTDQSGYALNYTGIESLGIEDSGSSAGIYSISFTPTPEPTTCGLLALGGLTVAGARRRCQKSQ